MKAKFLFFICTVICANVYADNVSDSLLKQKQCFYSAKSELDSMLSGKIPLNYERAVFITENAYRNNSVNYDVFQNVISFHANNIKKLAEANRNEKAQNFKPTFIETEQQKKDNYNNALYNWAIFTYLTDTTFFKLDSTSFYYHLPYKYPIHDPLGTIDCANSQVLNLLENKTGNCYAQTSLYKIFSERFNSGADICTAPGHVFISHKDVKGINYNVELATHSFPGTGSIMTLTYTPVDAVRHGIAMRALDLKKSVALCLVYLAKDYEHKFKNKTDDFLMQCAETTLQYDSLNLNAMLLKAAVLEEAILTKNKTIAQLQTDKQFQQYENLIVSLFNNGYREMPLDMKNLIVNRLQKDSMGFIMKDHTPKGFQSINPKDDRYATLSNGIFDEAHEPQLIEQYNRTLLNTKTKKIAKFISSDTLYNKYNFDPVVFAWCIDPLAAKYASYSPYVAFVDNPIFFVDPNGEEIFINGIKYVPPEKRDADYIKSISNSDNLAQETFKALDYVYQNASDPNGANKVQDLIDMKDVNLDIKTTAEFGQENKFIYTADEGGFINFNPFQAETYEGGSQSPTVSLAHEIDHAWKNNTLAEESRKTGKFGELTDYQASGGTPEGLVEEARATKGLETKIANSKGEGVRQPGEVPKEIYKSKGSLSTEKKRHVSKTERNQIEKTNEKLKTK